MLAKAQWEQECPELPFPNIIIKDDPSIASGALVELPKTKNFNFYPEIVLHPNLIIKENADQLLWVLGHELGHLFFRKKKMKPKVILNKKPNTFGSIYYLLTSFLFAQVVVSLFFEKEYLLASGLFSAIFFVLFNSLHKVNYRLNRYAEEFFCDRFSVLINKKTYLNDFTYGLFNFDSHPSDISRIKNIKENPYKSVKELEESTLKNGININFLENFFVLFK